MKSQGAMSSFGLYEDIFVVSALNMTQISIRWQAIVGGVGDLAPQHFKALSKHKADPQFVSNLLEKLDSKVEKKTVVELGLESVSKKVIEKLQQKLTNHHFDLIQLVNNMNKLAGNTK